MSDYGTFKHGGTTFPLSTSGSNALLRDADPAVFYALEYFAAMITTHIGARLLQEATAASAAQIAAAVAEMLPLNPEPYLTEEHIKFPLLAIYRKGSSFRYVGQRKLSVDEIEVSYVLPPLDASEAEKLLPILKAVAAVLDNRTEQGFDPAYTPSTPTGTAGEKVWAAPRAGLARVEIMSVTYGGYTPTQDLFFPAVVMSLRMQERSDPITGDLEQYRGADNVVDVQDPGDGTTVADVVEVDTQAPPSITSCTPSTGSSAGGTPVTVVGADFQVGSTPRVLFGGADASNIIVVDASHITCVTPAHSAYPTFAANVEIIAADGQRSNVLTTGFTFTSP